MGKRRTTGIQIRVEFADGYRVTTSRYAVRRRKEDWRVLIPQEPCPFCGEEAEKLNVCHECGREGCSACMPAGVGCPCPQCDEGGAG